MINVTYEEQLVLTHRTIYMNELELSVQEVIEGLPMHTALDLLSDWFHTLSTSITAKKKDFHVNTAMMMVFRINQKEQRDFLSFIQGGSLFNSPGFRFTTPDACIKLMQYLLRENNKKSGEFSRSDWTLFFHALLLCNAQSIKEDQPLFDHGFKGTADAFLSVVLPARMIDLKIHAERSYKVAFIKIYYFFQFCNGDSDYAAHASNFLNHYGLSHYSAYIYHILYPYLTLLSSPDSTNKIAVPDDAIFVKSILDRFCANGHEVKSTTDFLLLRQYPLYKVDSGTYLFLNLEFFMDKLYGGFLFDFVKVIQDSGKSKYNFGTLKQDMGDRFSEILLFYAVMKCFNAVGDKSLSGSELKVSLKEGEPDFYLRDSNKIFLFEFKDATIKSDVKACGDAAKIKQELIEKFELTPTGHKKGIRQLIPNIKGINGGLYMAVDPEQPEELEIYPVLVYTDLAMETEGVNYFLNQRLKNLLEEDNLSSNVKMLTLINLYTLILYQDYFRNGTLNLGVCLEAYFEYTSQNNLGNQMYSFDNFILHYMVVNRISIITTPQVVNDIMEEYKGI
jgi:hypothetical protein